MKKNKEITLYIDGTVTLKIVGEDDTDVQITTLDETGSIISEVYMYDEDVVELIKALEEMREYLQRTSTRKENRDE